MYSSQTIVSQSMARARLYSLTTGLVSAALGMIVLAGWFLDVELFKSVIPGLATMKVNTALLFVLSGLCLWLLTVPGLSPRWAYVISMAIVLLALATLSQDILGLDLGIDQWLIEDTALTQNAPGRMSPGTAFDFLLIGCTIFLLQTRRPSAVRWAQILSLLVILLSVLALIGYVYDVWSLYEVFVYTTMAVHTVVGFLFLAIGLFLLRPDIGPAAAVMGDDLQGNVLRRLLPYAVGIPVVVGWIRLRGQQIGLYGFEFGLVMMVTVSIVLFSAIIGWTARSLAQLESRRRAVEARYRTTLEGLMEGCQILGFDWRYLYINDSASRQVRRSKEELVGRTMMECFPGIEGTPLFTVLKNSMEKREPGQIENEFTYPDGSKGWFQLSIEPVDDGLFILSSDITNEKNMLEELHRHREHLEELVHARTLELEQANQELEAFSYSVSHDLRAPLRHIHGFATMLSKHATERLDEKGHRYLQTISDAARQMGTLIDDLLVFSRMARVDLHRTYLNMEKLVRDTIEEMNSEEEGRQIEWSVRSLPAAQGDPSMIRLVLQNLIANAVKYTRPRVQARIEIDGRDDHDEAVFCVRDNGVGFDMEYAHKLFGVFQRLHRADEFEGTGIGLANVRRIVSRHGGRTWAQGKVDEGAAFYFTLPMAEKGVEA